LLIVFFEIERDTYMPPRWVPIEGIDHSYFRALAALFTITLSFTAFEGFHRDLLRARHALRESHERSEGQLRAMLIRERANAERQLEFFSRVSHELRTPLAAIGAASDLLSQHRRKMTDEQITARVEKIQSSVKGLQGLIAETLDLSRIRTASLSSEETEFDLCEVTRDVFNTSRLFVDTDIPAEIITPEAALFVTMDEKLFRHVADNLITNGFKYAGDGQLRVELSEADETLSLTVQDTGIGMSETDLQQLFIPFHRGRNVAGIDGTGLGMTVVQEATSLLGGRLKIESELGVGTTASVALPRHPVADHEWDDMSEFMFPATRHGG
jgi:signal transduction histidine kinase